MSAARRRLVAVALAALTGMTPAVAHGQAGSDQVAAQARIISGVLIVTGLRDLNFGALTPGAPVIVAPTAPDAGHFVVEGERNQRVALALTLPTTLARVGGGASIPVSFGPGSAVLNRLFPSPTGAGASTFDPGAGTTARFGPTPRPYIYVWLGGTASPLAGIPSGLYLAPVVLTVAFLN